MASRDPDIASRSSIGSTDRRPNSVLDIFSAEGSWDPAFVLAPERLVGMQNEAAVRDKGSRRAKRVAWHRIDGPEARQDRFGKIFPTFLYLYFGM